MASELQARFEAAWGDHDHSEGPTQPWLNEHWDWVPGTQEERNSAEPQLQDVLCYAA